MDLERFDRQIRLFGRAGQERVTDSYVTIVGAGGTGGPDARGAAEEAGKGVPA